jgi:hypothetical protein
MASERPFSGPVSVGLAAAVLAVIAAFSFYTGFTHQLRTASPARNLREAQVVVMRPAPPSQVWQPTDAVQVAAEPQQTRPRRPALAPPPDATPSAQALAAVDAAQDVAASGAEPIADTLPARLSDEAPLASPDEAPH